MPSRGTGISPPSLRSTADGEPPKIAADQAIGKVEDDGKDAHQVEGGEEQAGFTLLEMDRKRAAA